MIAGGAIVAAAVTLAGCGGIVGSIVTTQQDIRSAGFSSASVGLADNDTNVMVTAGTSSAPTPADAREIAGIVWHDLHVRFGELRVDLHGGAATSSFVFPFATLQRTFGSRSPADNSTTLRQSLVHFGVVVIIVVAVVVVLVVVLIVLLVRRRRRRRRIGSGGAWGTPQEYQGYPGYQAGSFDGGRPDSPPGGPWGQGQGAPQGPWGAPAPGGPSPPSGGGSQGPGGDAWGRPVGAPPDDAG